MDTVLGERIARHGFAHRPCTTIAQAAALTCAIQAQDHAAARLGVRARATGVTEADVLAAVGEHRSVVRTWLMRGTIHLVDTADARWLVHLFGPEVARKFRTRWRQIGLTDAYLEQCLTVLPDILAEVPRTRAEVVDGLRERGIAVDFADPQAPVHILLYASCRGLVCRAGDRGRTATFTLLDTWLDGSPAGPRGDDALAELARRYFAAYSPATPADFTTWSGLGAGRAIDLIRDELTPCEVYGRPGFRFGECRPARGLRLLPAFDNYLLGYRHRGFLTDEWRGEVFVGGIIRPSLLHDGRVVGRWELQPSRDGITVRVFPFADLPRTARQGVEGEVADIGLFLGRPARLEVMG